MHLLPTTLGTRPRIAVEVRIEGVVAARAEDAAGLLTAVSRAKLAEGELTPGLRAGNVAGRTAVVAALRKALEAVALKTREVTLVVPDASVRVLLLDFDALPSKLAEALPVVRFRLKKLLPFDADDAAVSYQVMSVSRGMVRVVAVAMPSEVLAEYESVVREAGFEPGAVLPSTLAALAGLVEGDAPALMVNAGGQGVTTAIVRAGVLLLHRSVDLRAMESIVAPVSAPNMPAGLPLMEADSIPSLPLVDREASAEEWALQEPVSYGASAVPNRVFVDTDTPLEQQIVVEHAVVVTSNEVAQAVSVAAAYFEDTLETTPAEVLSAGPMDVSTLAGLLHEAGVGPVPVREMVDPAMLGATISGGVPRGWLAGVRGALAN